MKSRIATLLLGLLPALVHADDGQLKLLFNSQDSALAQALAVPHIELQADPKLRDLFQPRVLFLSRDGLTDQGVAQLGANAQQLIRLTVAAQSATPLAKPEDAFNGSSSDAAVYYIYAIVPASQEERQFAQQVLSAWYSPEVLNKIGVAGYTPPPSGIIEQNKVTLGLSTPRFPNGYR
jgi:hypothetical protein